MNSFQELNAQIEEMQNMYTKKEDELTQVKQTVQQLQEQKNQMAKNKKHFANRLSTSNIFDLYQEQNQLNLMLNQRFAIILTDQIVFSKTLLNKRLPSQATPLLSNFDNQMKKKYSFYPQGNISYRDSSVNQRPLMKQNQHQNENAQDSKILNLFPQNKVISIILANSKVNTKQQYLINPQQSDKQKVLQAQKQILKYGKKYNFPKQMRSQSYNLIYNNRSELNSINNNLNNFSQIYRGSQQHNQQSKL